MNAVAKGYIMPKLMKLAIDSHINGIVGLSTAVWIRAYSAAGAIWAEGSGLSR